MNASESAPPDEARIAVSSPQAATAIRPPVLAVTGLAKESRLASRPGVVAVGAGGNPERLRAVLAKRVAADYRAVVSIGIAGGLDPNLVPGDVVLASGVAADGRRFEADPRIVAALAAILAKPGLRTTVATLAGVERAVMSTAAKADLRSLTGAAVVDMESHVAADFAARHGLPFAAIRVVCDPAERSLPDVVASALKPNGEPDIAAVLAALARGRVHVGALVRLARDSSAAFSSLARCCALLGDGLGVPPGGEARPAG